MTRLPIFLSSLSCSPRLRTDKNRDVGLCICLRDGNNLKIGDWKDVGEGVNELRLDFGPGYRIYYARHLQVIVILLAGGDKSTQRKDLANAKHVWKELKHELT